nr:hypothetical protein [Tanacetum cinerariifolium]
MIKGRGESGEWGEWQESREERVYRDGGKTCGMNSGLKRGRDRIFKSDLENLEEIYKMMNGGVEYPHIRCTSHSETYAPYKPSPKLDLFEQPPCLESTFISPLWKSDQMHQTFEKSSLAMIHKLDDMIELPKSQSKKTYKKELECEIVMVKIPKCMPWLDACDEPIGDLDIMEDKVDNPSLQSTPQVFPSFKVYIPPVTYPKEVDETIGFSMEVEPFTIRNLMI